ncbi:amidohydrolase family protein [Gordonia sp. (in: high G+C Gram-positive bacteria)]|uniref:amidohydrolase family protein n=1 Tax=Gordonia sp. (in: high G+C Gram-positive bacteria) TaxID=84139 RepID=UPI0016B67D0A|nr:amidohydrolase family protein [Gordonia sp. (in: high G+C Gram-positive bacteria)]NLG46082.1 amidohydrolase [Gordonia sp. (in: high G+C Gram-positive bacteria)]
MCDDHDVKPFSDAEADAVRSRWQELGLPGLIDVHTHFMPRPVMDKVWAYFDSAGPMLGREWPIAYRADEEKRVEVLRSFGVRAFSSMIYPHKPDMAKWLNGWGIEFAAEHPDCLQTATFYPEEGATEYVAEAIEAGAAIFKSHIQVGAYSPIDPLLDGVWGQIDDAQIPVVIHCGSGPAPGEFTGPDRIATLLDRFPRLPLIVAHMGMPEYAEFLDFAERFDNVRLDTTMSFTDFSEEGAPFPKDLMKRLGDLGEKVLFGSDFPNIPYGYTHALDACARLGFGDDWLRAVFHDNASKLFGIS